MGQVKVCTTDAKLPITSTNTIERVIIFSPFIISWNVISFLIDGLLCLRLPLGVHAFYVSLKVQRYQNIKSLHCNPIEQ